MRRTCCSKKRAKNRPFSANQTLERISTAVHSGHDTGAVHDRFSFIDIDLQGNLSSSTQTVDDRRKACGCAFPSLVALMNQNRRHRSPPGRTC
jgi:hypothetical protein